MFSGKRNNNKKPQTDKNDSFAKRKQCDKIFITNKRDQLAAVVTVAAGEAQQPQSVANGNSSTTIE